MQFLIVNAVKKDSSVYIEADNHSVLVDGEKNGNLNNTIILDEGCLDISVDMPGAEEITIDLEDTTIEKPMVVTIEVN